MQSILSAQAFSHLSKQRRELSRTVLTRSDEAPELDLPSRRPDQSLTKLTPQLGVLGKSPLCRFREGFVVRISHLRYFR